MIYITQLIFLKEGKEQVFQEFENFSIPLMEQYNGKILYRIRPEKRNFIDNQQSELPYEIHFISFDSELNLQDFMADTERLKLIHLKDESVKSMVIVKGGTL